jgi:translocation and assembly module TamA
MTNCHLKIVREISQIPGGGLATVAVLFLFMAFATGSWGADPVELHIQGVTEDALANVKEALVFPPGLVSDDKVDRLWLERFAESAEGKVREALEPYGYYNARVKAGLETLKDGRYRLRVVIEPGEPVRMTAVNVGLEGTGSGEEPLVKLVDAFPLKKGDILLQEKYENSKGALLAKAQELGYLDAIFSLHEIRIDREKRGARIDLVLETGGPYRFGGTTIEGAPDYPERYLRRNLSYRSNDRFSFDSLGKTQLNFNNSERFRDVVVTPEKNESKDYQVPVLIKLQQVPRRSIRPGAGYGTDTGGRFSLRYRDLNLFHLGHEFNANLYLGERLQGLSLNYSVPSYRDLRSSVSLQANLQHEDVTTYSSSLASFEVDYNRGFGKGRLGTAYVKLEQEDFTVGDQESSSRLVLPGLRYTEEMFDNLIRPTRGYRFSLETRGTHRLLGSDTGFLQFLGDVSWLTPLPWRLSLHLRGKCGLTALRDSLSELPPSSRFFAGGDNSVRGYSYQSLGPRDATGDVVGGDHLLFGSVELERALFKDWGVSAFYDAGNAFDSFSNLHLAQGAGAGLHYYTPVGSLNLYLARQIGVSNPSFHIHFTVGFEL